MIPPIQGIDLEPTNICTLKCPGCSRTQFIEQWPQHWQNHSLDRSALMKFLDIDLSGLPVVMCGNYGDPIYHPDLVGMVRDLKQRGVAKIDLTTNGSHRKQSWWQEFTAELSADDVVTFSIDGIPENFTQYRINGDWPSILTAINECVKSPCKTAWKFIPFSYNQHDIEQARQLSQDLGIDSFEISLSDRFDEKTMHFKPNNELIGIRLENQQNWKKSILAKTINPQCHSGTMHFISADGHYAPCGYSIDHRFYYKSEFGKNRKQYSIQNTTLSEILTRSQVTEFYNNLTQQPVCQFNCGE